MPLQLQTVLNIFNSISAKILFVLLFILFSTQLATAQDVLVKDADSGEALISVTISSSDPLIATITDQNGKADLNAFKKSQLIEIRRLGYSTLYLSYNEIKENRFVVLMRTTDLNLDELVVSATRFHQFSTNVPSKITSISPQRIEMQNPQTSADLLGVSGKVFIQKSQQGGGSPMIRGFATNRLLYTVDGVRMNTAIFRSGNIQNVISLDPFAMESTEIMFGPGSVIYGSDAIGGVMAFQTIEPKFSPNGELFTKGQVAARMATANTEQTYHANVQIGLEKWAFVTSISSFDYNHLRQGSNGPDDYVKPFYVLRLDSVDQVVQQDDPLEQVPTGYHQYNVMQKVRFKPSADWDLQYGFHWSETDSYGRYDRHNRVRNGTARYAEWNYGPQKWLMNVFSADHRTENALYDRMSFKLAWQQFEESRIDRSFNRPNRSIRIEEVDAYSLNLDFNKRWSDSHQLFYGFEWIFNRVQSIGMDENIIEGTKVDGPSRYPNADWQSIALYLTDEVELSEQWSIQSGLRFNTYQIEADFDTRFYHFPFERAELNNTALVGSFGGVYRPKQEWVFRLNIATAFRAPNVDDMGKVFDSEPGLVVVPNPNLGAERAKSIDFGFARIFADRAKMDVSVYYTLLDNALVRRDFQLNGLDFIEYDGELSQVQAIQNAAKARVYGIQFGMEWELLKDLSVSTDLNYQEGEEEMDDGSTSPSRHAAPFFGVGRLSYKSGRLTMQTFIQFQGERTHDDLSVEEQGKDEIYAKDENGNTYAPSWYTLNYSMRYVLDQNYVISAGLENITDQRYRPYSSGISGAGRNFKLSIRAKF